ncbi:ISAs1 family transposase, partial [Vibrio parahaemolyticus]
VAIDGKKLNGSGRAKTTALHLVSAWRSGLEGICLGQVAAEDHSNEITAIPELLKILSLKGCLVTIDAIGCQKDIVEQIALENEADYLIAVK